MYRVNAERRKLNGEVQPDESIKCALSKELRRQAGKTAVDTYVRNREAKGIIGLKYPEKTNCKKVTKDIQNRTIE